MRSHPIRPQEGEAPTRPVARDAPARWMQFDLLTLFEWMLLAGLFIVVISSGGRNYTVWYRFAQLPADDVELRLWFEQHDPQFAFEIRREGQAVKFQAQRTSWFNATEPITPPWPLLGYVGLTAGGTEYSSVGFRFHALSLVIGVACILGMFWLRLRIRRS